MSNRALAAFAAVIVTTFLGLGHAAGQAINDSQPMEQVSHVFSPSFDPAGH